MADRDELSSRPLEEPGGVAGRGDDDLVASSDQRSDQRKQGSDVSFSGRRNNEYLHGPPTDTS
jgi:hypothetical protein